MAPHGASPGRPAERSLRKLIFALLAVSLCLASTAFAQETQREEPQPPKIIRKSGGVFQGSAINRVEPTYPPLAKAAKVSGSVVVEVTLNEEGKVISARALSGHPLLKDAAREAALAWKFAPTMLEGVPVKVIGTITFNFNLSGGADLFYKEIENLKEQIAANPNSAELHYKLGMAYHSYGRDSEAVEAYNQALQLKPDYAEAYHQLGYTYIKIGHYDKAIESINRSLALKVGDAEVYMDLSRAYLDADRQEDALEAARQALKLNPSFSQADACYALIGFVLLKQARYGEAVDALKEGAKLGPNQNHFHLYLGMVYAQAGDRESAMNEYKFLKEKRPEMANELMDFLNKQK